MKTKIDGAIVEITKQSDIEAVVNAANARLRIRGCVVRRYLQSIELYIVNIDGFHKFVNGIFGKVFFIFSS